MATEWRILFRAEPTHRCFGGNYPDLGTQLIQATSLEAVRADMGLEVQVLLRLAIGMGVCTSVFAPPCYAQAPTGPVDATALSTQGVAAAPAASINPITTVKLPLIPNPLSSTGSTNVSSPTLRGTLPAPSKPPTILPPGSSLIAPTLNSVTTPPFSMSMPSSGAQTPAAYNTPGTRSPLPALTGATTTSSINQVQAQPTAMGKSRN
jgi:hypothetical protein